ncbi:hypothetical protein CO058_03675 [candidate division WWE3 bacterium CG_4_9_14_0_2_um_filter_35_11]|uniref:UDP-N-acetylmuramoyl-tripeptide--D-alanyl-D-alanine ligase n=1 Tax=candidate division WWE3 bacterium CG_4_9_14_0_2_um_filter_35_11 TaxID=1975077 RepID=A0A2M8EKY0_UNCKA|nr:MAG: hypothetical protein COV25_02375 [candidate division WWE3 bacterium CG10_big_fil_rev_8_21_14_0_10_35_32]PJC23402.1 MAG: hypothetical protein CO058_03675 [candidate division WWE3 bacterium CG_4_9_14_0_2_um_filter_35_11]
MVEGGWIVISNKMKNKLNDYRRVSIDSRLVKPGDYFVPVVGETSNGHDYIDSAIKNGAVGVIEEQELYEIASEKLAIINPKVIAITGSVGKTTMRNFLSTILSEKYKVCVGSLNTKLGLAVNIVNSLKDTDEVFVAEAGMDRAGELLETGNFIKPEYAVITNISQSHMAKLGSLEAIKRAKAELLETITLGGKAFLNWDSENVRDIIGFVPENVEIIKYSLENLESEIDLKNLKLNFIVGPNYLNAIGAILICMKLGLSVEETIGGLEKIKPEKGRLNILKGINNSTIIDDTYNASPVSMIAGIKATSDYYSKSNLNGRKIAVIGGMLELGLYEDEGHKVSGEEILKEGFSEVVLVGELAKKYCIKDTPGVIVFACLDVVSAIEIIKNKIKPKEGDIILVKASQGIRLEKVVKEILLDTSLAQSLLVRQDERWNSK